MDPLREAQENEYAKIELKFLCKHGVRELRLRTIKGGTQTYVRQCIRCGNTSQPVKKEAAQIELNGIAAPEYDNDQENQWNNQKTSAYEAVRARFRNKRVDDYGEYLSSDNWTRKREKVIARAQGICEGCGEKSATEVHHISYEHVGNEFLFELVAVCSECHDSIHKSK